MIRAFWARECGGGRNFGDQLTTLLLTRWGVPHMWGRPSEAELFGVGSIVKKIPSEQGPFRGIVWGSGTIRKGVGRDLRRARVLAVRGTLTAKECRIARHRPALGDPGILAPDLVPAIELGAISRGNLGTVVVPHFVDHELAGRWPGRVVVAPTSSPVEFLTRIARAELVITSSLHGLITADAIGVPHVLDPHPDVIGGLWKFRDYVTAFDGPPIRPGVERLTDRPAMRECQGVHRRILDGLADEFGGSA